MKLRVYRSMTNLTQKQLAKRLGMSELSVIKYEAGTSIPSRDAMHRIYEETSGAVTPNDFYDLERIGLGIVGERMNTEREALVSVGLMSGTSMDGIDASILSTDGESFIKEIGSASIRYDDRFRVLAKAAERAAQLSRGDLSAAESRYEEAVSDYLSTNGVAPEKVASETRLLAEFLYGEARPLKLSDVVERSTRLHADAVEKVLGESGFKANEIDLIGYHGQTLYHRPGDGVTVQAGDPSYLAKLTGVPVVGDFRTNDVRHGGQGAPFAPLYHAALARQFGLAPVVVANCGGIANITVITRNDQDLTAFDTGPGNNLLDRFVFRKIGRPCDQDGALALQGTVSAVAMAALRERSVVLPGGRNYLDQPPPKSLDANDLHLVPELDAVSLPDACATLAAFTVDCIIDSLRWIEARKIDVPRLWIVAGGGWENPAILGGLADKLTARLGSDVRVQRADSVGWNGTALEAQIFSYLAVRSLKGAPLSTPGTTGVSEPVSGGTLALPAGKRASGRVKRFMGK